MGELTEERRDLRSAPRDGRIIWLWSKDEFSGPRAGYWHTSSKSKWWRSLTGQWINGATSWSEIPKADGFPPRGSGRAALQESNNADG